MAFIKNAERDPGISYFPEGEKRQKEYLLLKPQTLALTRIGQKHVLT